MLTDVAFGFACSLFLVPWASAVVYLLRIRHSLPPSSAVPRPFTRTELAAWILKGAPGLFVLAFGMVCLFQHRGLLALCLAGIAVFSSAIPALKLLIRLRLR